MLKVKNKDIVVPGEILCDDMDYLPNQGTYRDGKVIRASKLSLVKIDGKVIKTIPLSGRYSPRRGDTVIGKVFDIVMNGWRVELNCPYASFLNISEGSTSFIRKGEDLSNYIAIGEYVSGKITNVTGQNLIDITLKGPGLRKLEGGRVIKVNFTKVPRIIGKNGSMIKLIKQATNCFMTVGQNGWLWLKGEPKNEAIAIEAIRMIEEGAHRSGITESVKKFLEKKTKKDLGDDYGV